MREVICADCFYVSSEVPEPSVNAEDETNLGRKGESKGSMVKRESFLEVCCDSHSRDTDTHTGA